MKVLYEAHPGILWMKGLSCNFVWWPGMDQESETVVQQCVICHAPVEVPLHPWECPQRAWMRLHVDYAGPFMGKVFLIIIDPYSKWTEAHVMPSSAAKATTDNL